MHPNKLTCGIITANYNNSKYFLDYWQGLANQTVKPQYCIFIDDNSTENDVVKICEFLDIKPNIESYVNGIKFILITSDINSGPSKARNKGLAYLKNKVEIACICDSDDIFLPTKIEETLRIFNKCPTIGLVYSDYSVLDLKGNKTREYKPIFSAEKLLKECIISNNSAFRIKIIDTIGPYDEDRDIISLEDYDLWKRISCVSAIYHIPKSLYLYRVHSTNLTVATNREELSRRYGIAAKKFLEWRSKLK